METGNKRRAVISLLSPEPRVLKIKIKKEKSNPFGDKSPSIASLEDEKAITELRKILYKEDSPLSKKTYSPFSYRNRPPTRQKINPIIFDDKFIEINSSASTTEDSVSL
ncbi:hypothetical protein SteCoe_20888 [Stentor coeruleus]|uniref:Uncharacterized protein n=1 Tax=Stentor coeruleus TaxID=5963 RepID=A0A1R2BQV9_9CILI|nr:hypothetical protein SteCoe_20888 [Stentor coeruleus]